jgi:hypothetical protein
MTYKIYSNKAVIEEGNWNHKSGGDYWITTLENKGQLGSGEYAYKKYKLKYKQQE